MAKFRLLSAHYLPGDKYLLGDREEEAAGHGDERGTIVGDGTEHPISWPTLEMVALDAEAEEMLEKERQRLEIDAGMMNPVEQLPMNEYERDYVPGTNQRRRPMRAHGTPVRS